MTRHHSPLLLPACRDDAAVVVVDAEACSAAAALLDLQAAPPRMGEYLRFVFHCSSQKMKHSPMCALPSERRGNGEAKARGRGRGRRTRGAFRWWRRRGRRQRAGECDLPFFCSILPAIAHLDCSTAFTSMQRRGGSGGVGSEEGGKKDVGGNGDEGAARRAQKRRSNCRRQ